MTLEPQNPQKNQTTLSRIGHAFMAQFGEQYNLVVEPPNNYDPTNISIESCAAKNSSGSLQLIEVTSFLASFHKCYCDVK